MPDQRDKIKINVLMVCLGICRSPMAEAVLKHQITQRSSITERFDIRVDSAGTGAYHVGEQADQRTIAICKKHDVPISCRARAVSKDDYSKFDYILAMDDSNLENLLHRQPKNSTSALNKAKISLFGSYSSSIPIDKQGKSNTRAKAIADPYYGGRDGFENSFEACLDFSNGFLDYLERQ